MRYVLERGEIRSIERRPDRSDPAIKFIDKENYEIPEVRIVLESAAKGMIGVGILVHTVDIDGETPMLPR